MVCRPGLMVAHVYAMQALQRAGLTLADIDIFEFHEAFAAQVQGAGIGVKIESQPGCREVTSRERAPGMCWACGGPGRGEVGRWLTEQFFQHAVCIRCLQPSNAWLQTSLRSNI